MRRTRQFALVFCLVLLQTPSLLRGDDIEDGHLENDGDSDEALCSDGDSSESCLNAENQEDQNMDQTCASATTASQETNTCEHIGPFSCSMSESEIQDLRDDSKALWTVDDSLLTQLENDIQKLINCSKQDDKILFQTTRRIQPNASIIIPWDLTVTSSVHPGLSITCPPLGGVLEVWSSSLTVSNVHFLDCNRSGSVVSIIPRCQEEKTQKQVFFSNVKFSKNVLSVDQRLLEVTGSSSCVVLTMQDVAVFENQCEGQSCFLLSSQNTLSRLQIEDNRGLETSITPQAIFTCPADSQSTVNGLEAKENRIRIFQMKTGSLLNVSESLFRGTVSLNSASSEGGVLHSQNSTLSLNSCSFDFNSGFKGGVLFIQSSKLDLKDCQFSKNSAVLGKGGAVFLNDSTVEFTNCSFAQNEATEDGGVLYSESSEINLRFSNFTGSYTGGSGSIFLNNSSAKIQQVLLQDNTAEWYGGGLDSIGSTVEIQQVTVSKNSAGSGSGLSFRYQTKASISDCVLSNNSALYFGSLHTYEGSQIEIRRTVFVNNSANGGSALFLVAESTVKVQDSVFDGNLARFAGGAIFARFGAELSISNSSFTNNTVLVEDGGVLFAETVKLSILGCQFESNKAAKGGCFYITQSNLNISNSTVTNCKAMKNGGAFYLEQCTANLKEIKIHSNEASNGGGMYLEQSKANLKTTEIHSNEASKGGGMYITDETVLEGLELVLTANSARNSGGSMFITKGSELKITNSAFNRNEAYFNGSAIHAESSLVSLEGVQVTGSYSSHSGTLYLRHSSAILNTVVFFENTVEWFGGSVDTIGSDLEIKDCSLLKNSASAGPGFSLRYQTSARISNCSFHSNSARFYGAIHINEASEVSIKESSFLNNTSNAGSGVYLVTGALVEIQDCVFSGNFARYAGGAIFARFQSKLSILRSNFTNNEAEAYQGGAIFSETSNVSVHDCALDSNTANEGGAVFISEANLQISNSSFINCKAAANGGGICAKEESRVVGEGLTVTSNEAQVKGGGFAMLSGSTYNFQNCTIENNRAQIGPEIYKDTE